MTRTVRASGEPTLSELVRAKKLAEDMGQSPGALLALVQQLNRFGDIGTLDRCLTAVIELTGE